MTFKVEHWDDTPRDVKDRKKALYGIVLHGTGSGIVTKAFGLGHNPNDEAAGYYDKPKANFPNFMVLWETFNDLEGGWVETLQRASRYGWYGKSFSYGTEDPDVFMISETDNDQAWTSGTGEPINRLYRKGWARWSRYIVNNDKQLVDTGEQQFARYAWWLARWRNIAKHPQAVVPGRNDNANTIGVELVVPVKPKRHRRGWARVPFTDRQMQVAAWLCAGKFHEYGLPVDEAERRIVGHQDVNPIARSPFDPGHPEFFSWELFFDYFHRWTATFEAHPDQAAILTR